jgi:hypothetical protein
MVVRVTEGHYNQANGIDVSRSMRELTLSCDRWMLYSGEVACYLSMIIQIIKGAAAELRIVRVGPYPRISQSTERQQ